MNRNARLWDDLSRLQQEQHYHVISGGVIFPVLRGDATESGPYLCAYVEVPPGHPWHGQKDPYDLTRSIRLRIPEITFAGNVDVPGYAPDTWWIGFDTRGIHGEERGDIALICAWVGYTQAAIEITTPED